MSERLRIETRLKTLSDIHEIMGALRNTAVIESTRLRRLVPAQQDMLGTIERAVADFLSYQPAMAFDFDTAPVFIAVGSERGFCGDYNEALLDPLEKALSAGKAGAIIVGRRLAPLAERRVAVDAVIEGPSVSDDIPAVVERLAAALRARQTKDAPFLPLSLNLLHHTTDGHATRIEHRKPFPALARQQTPLPTPLRLQLAPQQMFAALVEQYLFAVLHAMLYTALLAENERRLQHLEGAMRRIDTRSAELGKRRNMLRQEEITEEIEVILLSTGALEQIGPGGLGEGAANFNI
jgi:F-type H+-transporting ATPase subunit gamma